MRPALPFTLVFLVGLGLVPSNASANPYELVKVGNNGQGARITFRGTSQPDGPRHLTVGANPVIQGNNLYAPDLLRVGSGWHNYFGGWMTGSDVNDRIYVGTRSNLEVNGSWGPQLAINNGQYIHVHDPSVVREGAQWHMLYTAARNVNSKFTDWINYSSSTNGINWTPSAGSVSTEVVMTDPFNLAGGAISDIARPSLVKTDSGWKMWFDAKIAGSNAISSYLAHATGAAPTHFQVFHKYNDVAGFPGFFEPDIARRADGTYVGVIQRHFATLHMVSSTDGLNFTVGPAVVNVNDPMFNRDFVSNPGLVYDDVADRVLGLGFGMTNSTNLTGHDIGFTHTHLQVQVRSPGGTWHVFAQANSLDEQFVHVFNFTNFDLVRIIDPRTNTTLLEQSFTGAAPGDIWEYRLIPEPALLAPLAAAMLLLSRRRASKGVRP
jgi:hypothetical protein